MCQQEDGYGDLNPNSCHMLGENMCPLIHVPLAGLVMVLICSEVQGGGLRSSWLSGLHRRLQVKLLSSLNFRGTLNSIP